MNDENTLPKEIQEEAQNFSFKKELAGTENSDTHIENTAEDKVSQDAETAAESLRIMSLAEKGMRNHGWNNDLAHEDKLRIIESAIDVEERIAFAEMPVEFRKDASDTREILKRLLKSEKKQPGSVSL